MDPIRASICRSQIAIVCSEHDDPRQKIISQATQRVLNILDPWISEDKAKFGDELAEFFNEAIGLWQPLQRAESHYVVNNNFGDWWNDDVWKGYSDLSLLPAAYSDMQQMSDLEFEPLINLFPRILGENDIIYHGRALSSTQAVVVAAKQELSQGSPRLRRTTVSQNIKETNQIRYERRPSSSIHDATQKASSEVRSEVSNSQIGSQQAHRTSSIASNKGKPGSAM
jgi:hypothetical protein